MLAVALCQCETLDDVTARQIRDPVRDKTQKQEEAFGTTKNTGLHAQQHQIGCQTHGSHIHSKLLLFFSFLQQLCVNLHVLKTDKSANNKQTMKQSETKQW